MTLYQNIHPNRKWKAVQAFLRGEDLGACVLLLLEDNEGERYHISLHYGFPYEEKIRFVKMFKEAVAAIPDVEEGGKEENGKPTV